MSAQPVNSRSDLLKLLCEAAELEHGIACSYLYAAFSLKRDTSEGGRTWQEQQTVRGWAAKIYFIASQEISAVRGPDPLAAAGARVLVVHAPHAGGYSSTRNQGWLHSGALYAVFRAPGVTRGPNFDAVRGRATVSRPSDVPRPGPRPRAVPVPAAIQPRYS